MNKIVRYATVYLTVLMLTTPIFAKNIVQVFVNSKKVQMEVKPVVKNGTTFIPLKAVGQNVGLTTNWNGQKKEVEVNNENKKIIFKLNNKTVTVNEDGKITTKQLIEAPFTVNNVTLVPIRFIVEEFIIPSLWDSSTYSYYITTDGTTPTVIDGVKPEIIEEVVKPVTPTDPTKPTTFVEPSKTAFLDQLRAMKGYTGMIGFAEGATISYGNTIKSGYYTDLRGTVTGNSYSFEGEYVTYPGQTTTNVKTTSNKHLKNEQIVSFLLKNTDVTFNTQAYKKEKVNYYVNLTEKQAKELLKLVADKKYVEATAGKTLAEGVITLEIQYDKSTPIVSIYSSLQFFDADYMNSMTYTYSEVLMYH